MPGRKGLSVSERLWQYIDVRGVDECWLWTGGRNRQGYGQFAMPTGRSGGRLVTAHRLAYEQFWRTELVGIACHTCNKKSCCNPLHVYDGTFSSNAKDIVRAGNHVFMRPEHPHARGERNGLARLNESAVRDIRARYAAGGISQQKLADEYGVNQSKISAVVRRETWAHVT